MILTYNFASIDVIPEMTSVISFFRLPAKKNMTMVGNRRLAHPT